MTKERELKYLVEVVPLGEFSRDSTELVWHKLNPHYVLPLGMRVKNVSSLLEIRDVDKSCVHISSIRLCEMEA